VGSFSRGVCLEELVVEDHRLVRAGEIRCMFGGAAGSPRHVGLPVSRARRRVDSTAEISVLDRV